MLMLQPFFRGAVIGRIVASACFSAVLLSAVYALSEDRRVFILALAIAVSPLGRPSGSRMMRKASPRRRNAWARRRSAWRARGDRGPRDPPGRHARGRRGAGGGGESPSGARDRPHRCLGVGGFRPRIRPELRPMKDALTRELDDLVTRRRQLVDRPDHPRGRSIDSKWPDPVRDPPSTRFHAPTGQPPLAGTPPRGQNAPGSGHLGLRKRPEHPASWTAGSCH
jgi:hypothetical protein